jgi:hypothetical protein
VHPVAGDDAVGGAHVLDLEHHPLVRLVRQVERLGDDAVESGALELVEPPQGDVAVGRGRRDVHGRTGVRQRLLERPAPVGERLCQQRPVAEREQVERHEMRRRLFREEPNAAVGGVDALLERLELEPFARGVWHDELAVHDAALGQVGLDRLDDLREIAGHRPRVPAADLDLVAISEHDRAEPVPLGLEREMVRRNLRDGLGEHRQDGRHDGQAHAGTISPPPGRHTAGRERPEQARGAAFGGVMTASRKPSRGSGRRVAA